VPASAVYVVKANAEKSKHLECATASINGKLIDFVQLRSEKYHEDSRIPSVTVADSPTKDAFRRDITINALFYNLHTRSVEDFTGKVKRYGWDAFG